MTKVFRRFRREEVGGDNAARYLLFAVGETLLVIIGILIALGIDSYQKDVDKVEAENLYLKNLSRDLESQIQYIQSQIDWEARFEEAGQPLIEEFFETSRFKVDSTLMFNLYILSFRKTFVRSDPTYTVLLSSGTIDLITNNELKNKLVAYYKELERLERIILSNNTAFIDQQFRPQVLRLVNVSNISLSADNQISYTDFVAQVKPSMKLLDRVSSDLLEEPRNQLELLNAIRFRVDLAMSHKGWMEQLLEDTQKLQEFIQADIEEASKDI